MRVICWIFAALAAAFGFVALGVSRSDIQIGIAANAIFSSVILVGLASVIGRIGKGAK